MYEWATEKGKGRINAERERRVERESKSVKGVRIWESMHGREGQGKVERERSCDLPFPNDFPSLSSLCFNTRRCNRNKGHGKVRTKGFGRSQVGRTHGLRDPGRRPWR